MKKTIRWAESGLADEVRGLILVRLLVLSVFALLLLGAAKSGVLGMSPVPPLALLGGVWGLTLLYWLGLRWRISLSFLIDAQIFLDLVLSTILVAATGNVTSPFVILYLLTVFTAGMFRERRGAFLAASAGVVLFAIVSFAANESLSRSKLVYEIFVHAASFFLLAYLSGALAKKTRQSEERADSATEELQRVLSSTDRILEVMPVGLLYTTTDGHVLRWNRATMELLGLDPTEDLRDRFAPELFGGAADAFETALHSALVTGKWALREEMELASDTDAPIPIGVSVTPIAESGDQVTGLVATITDLRQVRRLEREMMRSEQLASLGELAAQVAHEIRNPLASISGAVQVLHTDEVSGQKRELMELIVNESDRLNRTIDGFLDYTRDHSGSRSVHDLAATLKDVLRLVQHDRDLTLGRTILFEGPDGELLAEAEEAGMRQVFFNLARNALEAMEVGGILRVIIGREGDRIRVVFRDTGVGIEPAQLEHIFTPFHTTKSQGTGLGLSIASRIVEGNRGAIRAKSTPGMGTAFTVELPAYGNPSSAEASEPKKEGEPELPEHRLHGTRTNSDR